VHGIRRWGQARLLPGALRLLRHLSVSGIPFAIATSTPRATLQLKLATKPELARLVAGRVVCGDEVSAGKPAPDIFLAAARLMNVLPKDMEASDASMNSDGRTDSVLQNCIVVEDAPSGVQVRRFAIKACYAARSVLWLPAMRFELYRLVCIHPIWCLPQFLLWDLWLYFF
jgi:beta-phosphoglucomutase-like phosphatase (HAD superfamily)